MPPGGGEQPHARGATKAGAHPSRSGGITATTTASSAAVTPYARTGGSHRARRPALSHRLVAKNAR